MATDDHITEEEWRAIPGYEGLYQISNFGTVRSMPRMTTGKDGAVRPFPGKVLKFRQQRYGHMKVVLYSGHGKKTSRYVHQLVLEAFVGARPEGMMACHNDGNPTNNHVSNLRWASQSENTLDRIRHGNDPNLRKTHCPQGHEYTDENTVIGGHGERNCRACLNHRAKESYRKRAAEGGWVPIYGGECKHGHEFTPENTYMAPNGRRECRTCRKAAYRRARERRAAAKNGGIS